MHHSSLPRAAAVLSLLAVLALAHVPEAAAAPGAPGAAAAAYLRARAAASLTGTAGLRGLCLPGWGQLAGEQAIARGVRRGHIALSHTLTTSECRVAVGAVTVAPDGRSATVKAHAVTTLRWTTADGSRDCEATGLDHTIALRLVAGRWVVTGDTYFDDLAPRYLEAGGASQRAVRAAAARSEARSRTFAVSARDAVGLLADPKPSVRRPALYPAGSGSDGGPAIVRSTRLGYRAILYYDRDAAKAYADKYALSYNSTYRAFSADCANFGSQTMFAGGYPKALGGYDQGWWYDKEGTSSPGDDTWSHSWIAVIPQMQYWNARYTDVVSSIGDCARGDFVYYDWTATGRSRACTRDSERLKTEAWHDLAHVCTAPGEGTRGGQVPCWAAHFVTSPNPFRVSGRNRFESSTPERR